MIHISEIDKESCEKVFNLFFFKYCEGLRINKYSIYIPAIEKFKKNTGKSPN